MLADFYMTINYFLHTSSQLELERLLFLQQRGQSEDSLSSDRVVLSHLPLQASMRSEGDPSKFNASPKDREPQTSSRRPNCLFAQESASPRGAWTAGQLPSGGSMAQLVQSDVLENQINQWTETTDSCWFSKSVKRSLSKSGTDSHLGTHSEVVVEVLVHETPGSREPGNQQDPCDHL